MTWSIALVRTCTPAARATRVAAMDMTSRGAPPRSASSSCASCARSMLSAIGMSPVMLRLCVPRAVLPLLPWPPFGRAGLPAAGDSGRDIGLPPWSSKSSTSGVGHRHERTG